MKTQTLIGFLLSSAILLPTITTYAQTPPAPLPPSVSLNQELTPFELVTMAYQGFFEGEGIPPANGFVDQYENEQLDAEDLVRVAVQANRLPSERLSDRQYLEDVKTQLVGFIDLDPSGD